MWSHWTICFWTPKGNKATKFVYKMNICDVEYASYYRERQSLASQGRECSLPWVHTHTDIGCKQWTVHIYRYRTMLLRFLTLHKVSQLIRKLDIVSVPDCYNHQSGYLPPVTQRKDSVFSSFWGSLWGSRRETHRRISITATTEVVNPKPQ